MAVVVQHGRRDPVVGEKRKQARAERARVRAARKRPGRNERWCGGRERDDSAAMYRIGRKDRWDMNGHRWMRSERTRSQVSEGSLECGRRLRTDHSSHSSAVGWMPLSDDSLLVSLSTSVVSRQLWKCCSASACSGRQSAEQRMSGDRLDRSRREDEQARAMASSTVTHSLPRPSSGQVSLSSETWSG